MTDRFAIREHARIYQPAELDLRNAQADAHGLDQALRGCARTRSAALVPKSRSTSPPQLNQRGKPDPCTWCSTCDLMLVVTGARGSGKTALLDHLLGDAGPRWRTCRIEVDAETDPALLLSRVVAGFRAPGRSTDAGAPLPRARDLPAGPAQGARLRPVLVVDEAHLLPTVSLDPLTRLAADRKPARAWHRPARGRPPLLDARGTQRGAAACCT